MLTQKETARKLRINQGTISEWNREPRFRRLAAKVIRETCDPEFELAMRAATRKAMSGSPKHLEAILRARGMWDPYPSDPTMAGQGTGGTSGPGGPVLANFGTVTFVGLPVPPTPAQAEALRPPIGSNVIIAAPALPPARA